MMNRRNIYFASEIFLTSCLMVTQVQAERYDQSVGFEGPVKKRGSFWFCRSEVTVGVPDGQQDDYAIYGFTSEERRDDPCYVNILTENVNDSAKKLDTKKN